MKNIKWMVVAVAYIAFANASALQAQQDFKAVAHFAFQTKFDVNEGDEVDKFTQKTDDIALNEKVQDALKRGSQQEFIMEFTAGESSYKEIKKLAKPMGNGDYSLSFNAHNGSTAAVYKDLLKQQYIKSEDILGKDFLVTGPLESYDWQLTGETKTIGKYTCYQATFKPVLSQAEIEADEAEKQQGGILSMIPDEDNTITVWYTPEIPISNGPGVYQGLPGFILEVKEKHTILLCTKIEINPKNFDEVSKPKSGKMINVADFEALKIEKLGEAGNRSSGMSVNIIKG
ncbi:GLPGLI family protein [Nonlabens antarcticus]|uniref:GLPGLI family protein n=1 Tax=Nonlabens antarcticus TaxID=392714 RepID=UPI0018914B3F|nr:GLPGLI family protein [Nonlabens antarcticus]